MNFINNSYKKDYNVSFTSEEIIFPQNTSMLYPFITSHPINTAFDTFKFSNDIIPTSEYKLYDTEIKPHNYSTFNPVYKLFRPSNINNISSQKPPEKNIENKWSSLYKPKKNYVVLETIHITKPFGNKHATTPKNKKMNVTFNQTNNKIIYINGKDFYNKNNIKHEIWWSPQELSFIRNMFMNDVQKVNKKYPNKTPKECILKLIEQTN